MFYTKKFIILNFIFIINCIKELLIDKDTDNIFKFIMYIVNSD